MRVVPILAITFLSACHPFQDDVVQQKKTHSHVSKQTLQAHQTITQALNFKEQQDFEQANKGLIAKAPNQAIFNSAGEVIWDNSAYNFIQGDSPDTVNPSLWRQEKLNNIRGLFKVSDGVYQVRGFDFANMSIIEGKSGWIIVDPLTAKETAQAALKFAQQHLGVKPIKAIILTHAHMDHFGGVLGVTSPEEIKLQGIRVIAPEGFMDAATSENIIAGIAMARRSAYMYGKDLPRNIQGHIGSGLGTGPAFGQFGIVTPTELIYSNNTTKKIDGIDFIFQNASGTESIAELTFYLPALKIFCGAELVSRNMHNLYTLRGAQVRNALDWSNTIDKSLQMFGQSDIYFGSHHWPIWGNEKIKTFLANQRDLYKYIHDQSVRLLNQGLTANEIAEKITLPKSLASYFANRGYYGSLSHNAKAVYQYYMGWFDANPANLNPLPAYQSSKKYVELMGGEESILAKANESFDEGEYRWVAELLKHIIFTNPDNTAAKTLLAKTYQQLGYQSESAPWRNFYLMGARELELGVPNKGIDLAAMEDILKNTPVTKFFESMSVRLNSEKAKDESFNIILNFTDINESYLLKLNNSVLHHYALTKKTIKQNLVHDDDAEINASLSLTHNLFVKILIGKAGIKNTLFSDELSVDGNIIDLVSFFRLFDTPAGNFNIVTP